MTVLAVAYCPHPPALVPALACGAAPDLDTVRTASRSAVAAMLANTPDEVFVLGSGARTQTHARSARGSFARYGQPLEVGAGHEPATLPLSLTVGAWLLADAGYRGEVTYLEIAATAEHSTDADLDAAADAIAARHGQVAVLVMGDGSACRTPAAPGGLDPRAESFDRSVAAALASGDAHALAGVDRALAAELLVAGAGPWAVLGRLAAQSSPSSWSAELLADDAPWGVGYFVARWQHTSVS